MTKSLLRAFCEGIGASSLALALMASFVGPSTLTAKTYRVGPDGDWFGLLNGDDLKPGDEVVLMSGTYRDGRRLSLGHRGTAERPIVIRADAGARAVLHRPDARQNSINIEGAQYLVLKGIEITGGSTGIRMSAAGGHRCAFVTLEDLHIHHVGGPAITANHPGNVYEGLVFRRNHIHHTSVHAEGFYLGVNNRPDGSTAGYIFHCLIEGNYIHDLNGPKVLQGDGIEIKDGSYGNIVRDNVIHDTNYPGILVYGTDGKEPNVIERNVIWRSSDHGIQAAAEAVIRNNIVFDNGADGIYSRAHQSAQVGGLQILHNTVVSRRPNGAAIRVIPGTVNRLESPVVIANNAFYATGGGFAARLPRVAPAQLVLAGNVGQGRLEGINAVANELNLVGAFERDLDDHYYPRPRSALLGAADRRYLVADDFDGRARGKDRTSGAYAASLESAPAWTIQAGWKPLPVTETQP